MGGSSTWSDCKAKQQKNASLLLSRFKHCGTTSTLMVHFNGLTDPNSANLLMEMYDIGDSFLILLFSSLGTGGKSLQCCMLKTSFTCSQGSQYFRLNLFMLNISLMLIIPKRLPTQPDLFQPIPAPLRSDSLQSNIDHYVSGRVMCSDCLRASSRPICLVVTRGGHRAQSSVWWRKLVISPRNVEGFLRAH